MSHLFVQLGHLRIRQEIIPDLHLYQELCQIGPLLQIRHPLEQPLQHRVHHGLVTLQQPLAEPLGDVHRRLVLEHPEHAQDAEDRVLRGLLSDVDAVAGVNLGKDIAQDLGGNEKNIKRDIINLNSVCLLEWIKYFETYLGVVEQKDSDQTRFFFANRACCPCLQQLLARQRVEHDQVEVLLEGLVVELLNQELELLRHDGNSEFGEVGLQVQSVLRAGKIRVRRHVCKGIEREREINLDDSGRSVGQEGLQIFLFLSLWSYVGFPCVLVCRKMVRLFLFSLPL